MLEKHIPADIRGTGGPQFKRAMDCLQDTIVEGLHHGFFDCSITSEVIPGGKRLVMVRAGKSHKFTIPEDELPR
jgi:hypothetical protein